MKIRPHKNKKTGQKCWALDLGLVRQPDGSKKRIRQYFSTRDLATGALNEAKAKREWHGDSALAISFDDARRFIQVRDALAPYGATIEQAAAFFLKHQKPRSEPVGLAHLLARCLAEKEKLGARPRYLAQLKSSCLSFIRGREETPTHEVTRAEVKAWILGNEWAPKTQRVYLGDLRTLFAYAVGEGMLLDNPCTGEGPERIRLAEPNAAEISTFNAAEAKILLMRCARPPRDEDDEDFRPLLTYHALGLFCGIRPAELARMDRKQVRLDERHATIEASQAKTRRRRVVDIPENAVAWIQLDPEAEGKVAPPNFRRRWERLRETAGVPWAHDIMRHTFASMHYAAHQNEALLKAQMGHSSSEDVLFQHYRALKTRAEAAQFWAILPKP